MLLIFLFLIVALFGIVIIVINFWEYRKNNVAGKLFAEALRNENSGDFETAVIKYEKALMEAKQIRFQSQLKSKITEKIKLLHSAIEYKKTFHFTR
jgi:hypothetical protein